MPSPMFLIRRRRESARPGLPRAARLGVVLLLAIPLLLGGAATAVAHLYLEVTQIVPAVADIEAFFDQQQGSGFQPIRVLDRNGEPLFEMSNPRARRAEPVGLNGEAPIQAPEHLVAALVAAQDPTFWGNPGYVPAEAAASLAADLLRRGGPGEQTVTEQLIAATLLPVERYPDYSFRRDFRTLLLAERLTQRYEKQQILTWYLNSAHFGHGAYGVDAAALVYFGKHADGLTLAESALLAGLPGSRVDRTMSDSELRRSRNDVLRAMAEQGLVSARQARAARAEPVVLRREALAESPDPILEPLTRRLLLERLGPEVLNRGGLTAHLTIDAELQAQASCALATQRRRLQGDEATVIAPAPDGGECTAAALLPPLRPGDSGVDHQLQAGAVVVYSPADGELRAVATAPAGSGPGAAIEPAAAGETLYPFVYLTAFARGFAPASMVLDLPQEAGLPAEELAAYQGPVSMRRAIVGRLDAAAQRTLELAGLENVMRTLGPMGLRGPEGRRPSAEEIIAGELPTDLITLTQAYGTLANGGRRVGTLGQAGQLQPLLVERVVDRFERPVFEASTDSQSILGDGLAYLLIDVLADDASRWSVYGQPNVFEIGRPAGTVVGEAPAADGFWTVGFTPDLSVGVWMGNPDGGPTRRLSAENGPGAVWHAVARHVTREQPAQGWSPPMAISRVEVCVPSGLLPTEHCPDVVGEVFLQGTEPTTEDHLYQPFRVNRVSGRLATLQTPLSLVEERVYLIPPPEAAEWADAAGIEQPPSQYDPLAAGQFSSSQVAIDDPEPFGVVSGEVVVRGEARPERFAYYRLQYGEGLNPSRWLQIGGDRMRRVWNGVLGSWDTAGLSGLYTLQLVAVTEDNQVRTASVPVTVDGEPPLIEVLLPLAGERLQAQEGTFFVEVTAQDDVAVERVELYLDELQVATLEDAPFLAAIELPAPGAHSFHAVAVDSAGRRSQSETVEFMVVP